MDTQWPGHSANPLTEALDVCVISLIVMDICIT